MVNSITTIHANKRCQQRGISSDVSDCVRRYGEECYATRGCLRYQLNKRSLQDAFAEGYYNKQTIEKASKVYVIASGEIEITWAHHTQKIFRDLQLRDLQKGRGRE